MLEKKRDLEGDYPEAFGKILKKDDLYLFLKRELKYWEKFNEISDNAEAQKTKPIPQLPANLSDEQRETLFDLLVKAKFIPGTINKEGFIWAFTELKFSPVSFVSYYLSHALSLPVKLIDKAPKIIDDHFNCRFIYF